ncbi:MAG: hypothetical protein HWN79_10650 [Candidatus Lokiarchaeota archaeon]|nr:hypothetical protein [Candidatus Lokiarchaeota archaeon]
MGKIKEKSAQGRNHSTKEINKGHVSINWGRQGGVILSYLVVLIGFYGIIANIIMVDAYGNWISYLDPRIDGRILIWPYTTYLQTYFLPILLLFLISFILTYKEDIPLYGIKASLWLIPSIIIEGFVFYWMMFGLSLEPFVLQFGTGEGYLNILILFLITITGSFSGMKIKQLLSRRKK